MSTPGIADPYWYEWYVGLKSIIEMLNPDSGIISVTFQHGEYDTLDDVVVEYADSGKQICYQVKHEISTSKKCNLTFAKLLETGENKKSLISAMFYGWQDAIKINKGNIEPVLFTNRSMGTNKTRRSVNGVEYTANPLNIFITSIKDKLDGFDDIENLNIDDKNILLQWEELCKNINADKKSMAR